MGKWPSGWLLTLLCLVALPLLADDTVPPGPFTRTECIRCHVEKDPGLIRQWREGPHSSASGVGCNSCHGDTHEGSAAKARRDRGCIGCHEGPVSHSYGTSKHGVVTRLEKGGHKWRPPLQRGNYRTPGCSYCHLHDGDHGNSMAPDRGPEVRQWICSGCHSPRYVRELFANAQRQLEIADLKLTEGETLLRSAGEPLPDSFAGLRHALDQHRQNVLLGVGHQSPDYQWWYGQPALDGDLIRIRDAVADSRRLDASLPQTKRQSHTAQHTEREK